MWDDVSWSITWTLAVSRQRAVGDISVNNGLSAGNQWGSPWLKACRCIIVDRHLQPQPQWRTSAWSRAAACGREAAVSIFYCYYSDYVAVTCFIMAAAPLGVFLNLQSLMTHPLWDDCAKITRCMDYSLRPTVPEFIKRSVGAELQPLHAVLFHKSAETLPGWRVLLWSDGLIEPLCFLLRLRKSSVTFECGLSWEAQSSICCQSLSGSSKRKQTLNSLRAANLSLLNSSRY